MYSLDRKSGGRLALLAVKLQLSTAVHDGQLPLLLQLLLVSPADRL